MVSTYASTGSLRDALLTWPWRPSLRELAGRKQPQGSIEKQVRYSKGLHCKWCTQSQPKTSPLLASACGVWFTSGSGGGILVDRSLPENLNSKPCSPNPQHQLPTKISPQAPSQGPALTPPRRGGWAHDLGAAAPPRPGQRPTVGRALQSSRPGADA